MISIIRTNADDLEFKNLVQLLNSELSDRDGGDHPLSQYNPIDTLKYVVLAFENQKVIACGAIGEYDQSTMEIKRMFVLPKARGKSVATKILVELENWAAEMSKKKCVLFTGSKQPEAIRLYEKNGYKQIEKYGKLAEISDSLCFGKEL